jgi:hypothetical protein
LRRQLLQSSLFDGERFAKQFEQALVNMWMQKIGIDGGTVSNTAYHDDQH